MRKAGLFVLLLFGPPLPAQTPQQKPVCTAPEHSQFDFWVGRWEVFPTGKDTLVARSLIERLYDGCAIRENWMPLKGAGGGSLNSWRSDNREWRQIWTDSSGAWDEYVGGRVGDAMVLTAKTKDATGKPVLARMRFTSESDGSVRQLGTTSSDEGMSWTPNYDFTYRPAP